MGTYKNLSDIVTVQEYMGNTESVLKITSVASKLAVQFPAFLTDFSQNFDPQWNSEDVFGRMDPISTYQGTKRTMSLGFDVVAGTQDGAKKNLKRCKDLVKMVYPVYKKNILSKPPLVRIRFANLIIGSIKSNTLATDAVGESDPIHQQEINKRNTGTTATGQKFDVHGDKIKIQNGQVQSTEQHFGGSQMNAPIDATPGTSVSQSYVGLLGWIGGLNWKPNLEMGMFSDGSNFYPKVISISFTFNVLHEHTPSQSGKGVAGFPFKT